MQLQSEAALKRMTGMVLVGADLKTPEGTFLFVSASLKPDASFEDLRGTLLKHVDRLGSDAGAVRRAEGFGQQLAFGMTQIPDRQVLKSWSSSQTPISMIEGNVGLRLGMQAHRYGGARESLVEALESVSSAGIQQAAQEHLSAEGATVCTLQPARVDGNGE
jgi:hypothetical protein